MGELASQARLGGARRAGLGALTLHALPPCGRGLRGLRLPRRELRAAAHAPLADRGISDTEDLPAGAMNADFREFVDWVGESLFADCPKATAARIMHAFTWRWIAEHEPEYRIPRSNTGGYSWASSSVEQTVMTWTP